MSESLVENIIILKISIPGNNVMIGRRFSYRL